MITRPITRPVTSPLARAVTAGAAIWNPRALFRNGEQGWWFDNNDLSTLFQDAAGTIPVTGPGQPVGLQLDRSRGLVLGANAWAAASKTFDAGWSELPDGAQAVNAADNTYARIPFPGFAVGRMYLVQFECYDYVAGQFGLTIRGGGDPLRSGNGVFSEYVRVAADSIHVGIRSNGGLTAKFRGVSIRELPGNHRFQANAASHPMLRQNTVTGAYYLETDGSDDWLVTNSINFTSTDKVTLFTGVRKLSNPTDGALLVELSTSVGANNGAFNVLSTAPGTTTIRYNSRGTAPAQVNSASLSAPTSQVVSATSGIGTDQVDLRLNGTQTGSSSTDQGTGPYGNYPAYFFRRAGTSLPFNGHEYGSICVGRLCTAAEISAVERLLAQRMGVTLA